jgi:hypothetical protein
MAWHHLQYVLGLARLGHDVFFFEDSQDYPSCYDPSRGVTDADATYGLRFAEQAFTMIDLAERFAYYDSNTSSWVGPAASQAGEICATADVLLNMSGKNPLRPWFADIPHRVLIDTDPAFVQIRHLEDEGAKERALGHTAFLTFGENISAGCSRVPQDGFAWRATRQPIVLDVWPVVPPPRDGRFTTVMLGDSYQSRRRDGVSYGMKSKSFEPLLDLPARVGRIFELAVGGSSVPKAELRARGWDLVNPLEAALMPEDYRQFIQNSKAEFSVAKHGYVVSRCGWFSERSAAYLASGRPVVVQDTGFSSWMKAGAGVLAFKDPDEAAAGIAEVNSRYEYHCEVARAVAEEYFDSKRVLSRLLEDACVGADQPIQIRDAE